jgi:hypothetical protein
MAIERALSLDLVALISITRAWWMAAGCSHVYENIYTLIEKVIPCSGRVCLRETALIALVFAQPQPSRLKPHFCLRLD